MAAGNGGQKMSQYSWFTVYGYKNGKCKTKTHLCDCHVYERDR